MRDEENHLALQDTAETRPTRDTEAFMTRCRKRCHVYVAVLLAGTLLCAPALALHLRAAQASRTSSSPNRQLGLTCNIADGFTLAAVGDLLIPRPASMSTDPNFRAAAGILQNADISFGNFEANAVDIRKFKGYPYGDSGDVWVTAVPEVPADLKRMGFKMVSRANNHTTDWGVDGMRETDRRLDEAGLIHAGSGENRGAARAARYLDTPQGRVGLVSFASTFNPASMAMAPLGEAPGRPGMNALRTTPYAVVTPEMMQNLKRIWESQPEGSNGSSLQNGNPGDLSLLGVQYRVGTHTGFSFEMNKIDLEEILQAIRQGKQNSDFVIATIHAHEPGRWSEEPADFLPVLAHQAIDAGADVFIGHGPHRLRGIEIYKAKPIFYSLGNFFYQDQLQQPMAGDLYETADLDPRGRTDAELGAGFVDLYFSNEIWYQSVIAVSKFEQGRASEIRLYPIDLGLTRRNAHRGEPRLATPQVSRQILERLQRLSRPYGTVIEIEQSVGIIRLPREARNSP
jgi:poly-gamma-glutamate capsule biosynthesis protein CapA/YwtB (metallophosphatase superfamily)